MIDDPTLRNLFAWSLQVGLLVAAAGLLPRLLRIESPVLRHAYWRVLLVICLALPFCQPWRTTPVTAPAQLIDAAVAAAPRPAPSTQSSPIPPPPTQAHASRDWAAALVPVLMTVALARFLWLAGGIARLRRLRRRAMHLAIEAGSAELEGLDTRGARIIYVRAIRQPVTFGLRRPVVCLPESLRSKPSDMRRVVIAHELWHVRRRDWLWLLVEESLRSVLWFHPAIVWLISRIQRAREEVVDELTVRQTNARRTYLQALLVFADEPALFPAASFARRRHLFHRMQLLTREAVMSSKRVITFAVAVAGVVAVVSVYGATRFPLTATAPPGPASQQTPPRDPKPGQPSQPASRETALKNALARQPGAPAPYLELASLQEERGAIAEAEATLSAANSAAPNNTMVLRAQASFYNRQGDFQRTMDALEAVAAVDPTDIARHQTIATYYWEKVYKDQRITAAEKHAYLQAGLAASDRAIALDSNYADALVFKNLLLRLLAKEQTDDAKRTQLNKEADALRDRAIELKRSNRDTGTPHPPPPPPPPPPPRKVAEAGSAMAPPPPPPPPPSRVIRVDDKVVVGSRILAPRKVKDVPPVYPPIAAAAKVAGVVIVEATIDETGRVTEARVLRSIPLLDQAAFEAVRQWEFEPTMLNGRPVPIVVALTVTFPPR